MSAEPAVLPDERYHRVTVPVRGGDLMVGVWEAQADTLSTSPGGVQRSVLAVHGITSSHLAWPAVAAALPDVRIIAPDLRGRGRSRDLPGPYGMPTHADDCAAVLDHLGVDRVVAVGHSMGAFVCLVLADRHGARVSSLVLIDGGMPLLPPAGIAPEELADAVLTPVSQRLERTFPSRTAYRDYWLAHPAIGPWWSELTAAYVDYDLVGVEPELRSATRVEALEEDTRELVDGESVSGALQRLTHPTSWLLAPRGLMDEVPPLYPPAAREHWRAQHPQVEVGEIEDVNHYTAVMAPDGAAQLEPWIRRALADR
ncbi:MAG: alpha/beta hydrolase [Ornithinimicrobium sp.]|uniref:alpha/beta hydrolase n=1 Tax=Ornithinimicrobium sp. TaxID=1977084 RepID=UPI003D9B42E4